MRIMGVRLRMRRMPASSEATAASTSVMMLPGPMAFTRTPCGAIASAIDLQATRLASISIQLQPENSGSISLPSVCAYQILRPKENKDTRESDDLELDYLNECCFLLETPPTRTCCITQ